MQTTHNREIRHLLSGFSVSGSFLAVLLQLNTRVRCQLLSGCQRRALGGQVRLKPIAFRCQRPYSGGQCCQLSLRSGVRIGMRSQSLSLRTLTIALLLCANVQQCT